jgi:hypothetical protein
VTPIRIILIAVPVVVLLLTCAGAIGFFFAIKLQPSSPKSPEPGNAKGPEPGNVKPPDEVFDPTRDFDGLGNWCEKSASEIKHLRAANPIRGGELASKHLEELRGRLLGKEIRWRLKVQVIAMNNFPVRLEDGVYLRSYWTHTVQKVDQFGRTHEEERPDLIASFREAGPISTKDTKYLERWAAVSINNIPQRKLHDISVGDYVMVTGRIKLVDTTQDWGAGDTYRIYVPDARIE